MRCSNLASFHKILPAAQWPCALPGMDASVETQQKRCKNYRKPMKIENP
jgi:hypothetical protein